MDILAILLGIAVLWGLLAMLFSAASIIAVVLWFLLRYVWPLILGVTGCVLLWRAGHDNLGVAVGLLGLIGEVFVWRTLPDDASGPSWDHDKVKIYDKDKKVIGYHDRES